MAISGGATVNIAQKPNLDSQLAPEMQANVDMAPILWPEDKRQLTKEQKTWLTKGLIPSSLLDRYGAKIIDAANKGNLTAEYFKGTVVAIRHFLTRKRKEVPPIPIPYYQALRLGIFGLATQFIGTLAPNYPNGVDSHTLARILGVWAIYGSPENEGSLYSGMQGEVRFHGMQSNLAQELEQIDNAYTRFYSSAQASYTEANLIHLLQAHLHGAIAESIVLITLSLHKDFLNSQEAQPPLFISTPLADTQNGFDILMRQGNQKHYLDVKVSGESAENRTCVIISPLNQKPRKWINEILAALRPTQGAVRSQARVQKAFVV